jgi:N-sulfoglucosamine sulfohydrolase
MTGTRVPLIISLPEKYKELSPSIPGSVVDDLVNFVDLAPTILSLAGLKIPEYMQGIPILGEDADPERQYIYAIRDRVDEVLDFSRSVRSDRYHYIRNFYPHRPRMQRSFYSEMTPLRQEIRRLHSVGHLNEPEQWLMAPVKPP